MSTIIWQYEKKISSQKMTAMLLTGLFAPCNCSFCLRESSDDVPSYYSYRVGSSSYYCYFRPTYNVDGIFFQSYYYNCPKLDGAIVIGGFEEIFPMLDSFDQEVVVFNINLFSAT